jgi:CHASE3 domain sensor protein
MQNAAVLVPLGLLCMLVLGLGFAVRALLKSSSLATRSDRVIALAERNRKLLIDEETGLRGYLLTRDRVFLAPLEQARRDLPFVRQELQALITDDPQQLARYSTFQRLAGEWEHFADLQLDHTGGQPPESVTEQLSGKQKMDAVRSAIDEFINSESALTKARSENARILGSWAVTVHGLLHAP